MFARWLEGEIRNRESDLLGMTPEQARELVVGYPARREAAIAAKAKEHVKLCDMAIEHAAMGGHTTVLRCATGECAAEILKIVQAEYQLRGFRVSMKDKVGLQISWD